MKQRALLFVFLMLFLAAVPAAAEPTVVFEPESIFFLNDRSLDKQAATSVTISLEDDSEIKAIRFGEYEAVSYDIFSGTLFVSSDITVDGARVTFHGDVPSNLAYSPLVRVRLYGDDAASLEIASADLPVRIGYRYQMTFEDAPAIVSGESLDIRIKVTFDDNVTGSEDLVLPLESLTPVSRTGDDLGLTLTPDRTTSTIRIASNGAKLGTETYYFAAASDSGTIQDSGFDITVTEHALSFSTRMLLAMATEEVDYYVTFVKKPADLPLASFDVAMTIADDDYDEDDPDSVAVFPAVSSDTGVLRWNGLSVDLEIEASRLRIHGTAAEEWEGELILAGWPKGGDRSDDPALVSDPLNIATLVFDDGDVLDLDSATISDPERSGLSRMTLGVENTLTIPLLYDLEEKNVGVTVRTPSRTVEQISPDDAGIAASRAANQKLVIRYTPREAGDYLFEFLYVEDGVPYYEDSLVGAGDTGGSSSSGCNAGFAALSLAAAAAFALRKKR